VALGPRQKLILDALEGGPMRPVGVGRLLHRRHYGDKHVDQVDDQGIANGGFGPCCFYCLDDARDVLDSLRGQGLVEQGSGGWALATAAVPD
jgi:hypothetical protein